MSISNTRRLYNNISELRDKSDHKINPQHYYVVELKLSLDNDDNSKLIATAKAFLKKRITHLPIIAYVFQHNLILLYSSLEKDTETHYKNGSHQHICSEFVSILSREYDCMVECSIVEFESKTQILTYFHCMIFQNTIQCAVNVSSHTISKKEAQTLTSQELHELLETRTGINWDDVSSPQKHGTFYKYITDGNKEKFSTLSEFIDFRDIKKYETYLFE